ncbi:hypothetical protein TI10_04565 [Photorhabdus luminescens subsp. luminescens]|uniref:Molecular chaperone DnaJ n=1 Tax=Photorhabdus luminescens TaxID=29488 RepID=A0A1G5Q9H7_PHOLU|nr:hypothetical protein [Photorhabdus luminescens]KMW75011.1 hypothetical protein TI10_04565 [Photorhabdus luminescens subsp. luminescens]SCZ58268.1 hypothetical protein SAMN02982990_01182 [Photorhabdus luminescens]
MHKKLKKSKSSGQQIPKTPQQQFKTYWKSIEKYQLKIAKLQQQQDELFMRFQQEILPVEHQYMQSRYDKAARLLSFADKKSLGKNQRRELFSWIEEELAGLCTYPFNENLDLNKLTDHFSNLHAFKEEEIPTPEQMAEIRQAFDEYFDLNEEISDEELLDMIKNPEKMRAAIEQHFQRESEHFHDEYDAEETTDFDPAAEDQKKLDSLFKSQEVSQMYRKIAKVLHPDREQDLDEKKKKNQLMVQLSQAKKDNDVWTIINMYHQYIDPTFSFNSRDISDVNKLLKARIDILANELNQLKKSDSLPGMIWRTLGGETSKAIENNLHEHCKKLRQNIENEIQLRESLRSLTVLKSYLAERRDALEFEQEMIDYFFKQY